MCTRRDAGVSAAVDLGASIITGIDPKPHQLHDVGRCAPLRRPLARPS